MKTILKKYAIFILVGLVVLTSLIIGLFQHEEPAPTTIPPITNTPQSNTTYIYVDIKGQVQNPGVYKVESTTRLYQLIFMAGGLTEEANSLLINMSMTLRDEDIIYIPSIHEEIDDIPIDPNPNDDLIDINEAGIDQLTTLPGIGPSTAQKIIDYRNEVGDFETIEDIKNVSGIGDSTFENIKDLIKT